VHKIAQIDQFKSDNEDRTKTGQILHDQLRILFAHILPNTFGSVAIIIVYFWVCSGSFSTNLQYYWATTILALFLVRVLFYLRSLKGSLMRKPKKWLYSYSALMFAIGAVWGSMLFIPSELVEDEFTTLAIVMLLMGLASISSISSAAHPIVIWSFLLPVGFLSSIFLLNYPANEFGLIMSVGVLAFCGATGFVGHTIHKMIVSALHLEAHNTSLMDEVVQIAKQNQKSYEGFQVLLDNLGAGAAMFDKNQKLVSWNKSFENIFNLPTGLLKRGMSLHDVIRKIIKQSWQNNIDVNQAADAHIREILSGTGGNEMAKLVLADGRNLYSKVMKISNNQLVLNYTDVTSLEQARADDIIHVLQHDSLTGLPNQVLHKKEVRRRIIEFSRDMSDNEGEKDAQFMALIHFGLNSLNEIYEFLGLSAGDQVVSEVASRCKIFLGDDAHLAHVAYDEFHIVTSHQGNIEDVVKLAEELVRVIKEPIDIAGNSITMTTSVGISTYPEHADKPDILNRNAKIAFNKAKLPKEENIIVYNSGMHSEIMQRTNMLFDIRDSIENSEFLLNYQPQIDVKNGNVIGVEALLRWQHPDKGWISPEDFIPLAEHTKQIIPLTEQFLPEACYQAKLWQQLGLPPLKMSVNISPFHFHERGFTKFVRDCFEQADLEPEFLDLEITEGVIMSQTEEIINVLHELSEMGVMLSIDDFGTGYSSLAYLRSLPVDKLKIDQTFIKDMNNNESALSLVEAVIRLGHSFNLNVMAEGVETEVQLSKLKDLNCDQAQGFLIKRPDNADEITKWIKENYT
tara:strand:+ start:14303 stop:16690 length:2388 start_codon:yes stop_codon:yes gene_type:complete